MKKNLALILLAGVLSLTPFNKKNKISQLDNKPKYDIERLLYEKEDTILPKKPAYAKKEFTHSDMKKLLEETDMKNEEYLNENTKNIFLFNDDRELKDSLIVELREKEHAFRMPRPVYFEHYYQVNYLSTDQNKVIYLILSSLKDSSFTNEIGRIIKKDIENKYTEMGGIINFKKENKIELNCLESELAKQKKEENDCRYLFPPGAVFMKKIAYFHLHSSQFDESSYAGPSSEDLMSSQQTSYFLRTDNNFLITSLKKGKFNIDYFGVDTINDKKVRTVDLGNYYYDTLKIK